MSTNMAAHVLIGFLLVCTVTGLPVEKETDDDIFTEIDYALFSDKEMYVYDDNENLAKLTISEYEESEESQEIISRNFPKYVSFYLYTSKNPTAPQKLLVDDADVLKNSNFDPKRPTRFVTHGWINSYLSPACTLIRDAYIRHGDYNVIVIDWGRITSKPYVWASKQVRPVGHYVSTMINFLQKHGLDVSQVTMVGHSLGAHVVGLAAREAKGKISYVVGLDPALPGFQLAGPGSRISSGDAKYVEIIHTNAGLLGFLTPIGHSDFYPNGGSKQLGCLVDPGGACSHARSYRFFAESVNSQVGFHGRNCDSYTRFKMGLCKKRATSLMGGLKRLFKASGTYYLATRPVFPYAKGKLI